MSQAAEVVANERKTIKSQVSFTDHTLSGSKEHKMV